MKRVTEQQAFFAALFALASRGLKFYWPKAPDLSGYGPEVRKALVTDYQEAKRVRAYAVERPFFGNYKHGYRLVRFIKDASGAQADVGPMFETARAFADAMRVAEEMGGAK